MADVIVLLRGLARGQHYWLDFPEQLQQRFPGKRVVALDLAGNGERFAEPSPATIAAAVEDIRQQLQQQGLQPPYQVVGLSLGGMIALEWLHSSNEVERAVIINSSHAGLCSVFERMYPRAMLRLLCALFYSARLREQQVYWLTSDKGYRQAVVARWQALARQQPVSRANFWRQIRIARSFTRTLKPHPDNTLVLVAEHDHLVSPRCSRKLAQALQCPLHSNDKAGHDLPLDEPEWVQDQLLAFLY